MTLSICMSSRNRGHLLGESLRSIKAKNYAQTEVLVIDDSSTDRTAEVLRQAPWVRGHRIDRGGGYREDPAEVFNLMLGMATGTVLLQQSAEVVHLTDVGRQLREAVEPGVVAFATVISGAPGNRRVAEAFVARGWVANGGEWTGQDNRSVINPDGVRPDGGQGTVIPPPRVKMGNQAFDLYTGADRPAPLFFCGAMLKDDWEKTGGYPVGIPHGASDLHLAVRMMRLGFRFRFLGGAIAYHQEHRKS